MPCLAHEYHPRLPASKSLSCLPCLGTPAAGWSSGDDSHDDDELDTKQAILNEMRNREMKKRSSRCSVDSPTLSGAFVWSFTQLDPRSPLEKASSPEECIAVEENEEATDGDDESEAFFSVKSFFTRSTSRAATVASSTDMDPPATWEGLRRGCEGWPFGLCRRPAVPPLPSTPADSWKWRKRSGSSNLAVRVRPDHSTAPAYSLKITTS